MQTFDTDVYAVYRLKRRIGDIIVRVVNQYGNPIAEATLTATMAEVATPGDLLLQCHLVFQVLIHQIQLCYQVLMYLDL